MQLLRLDWNVVFTIINLIVLYLLLKKFLIGPITAVMQKREDIIHAGLADARQKQEEAGERKKQYEDILANADKEAEQILEAAKKEAQEAYDKRMKEAEQKEKELLEHAQKKIELEREKTMQELQSQIAVLALAAARKIIGEQSELETTEFLYKQFLEKAGEQHDADSQ